MKGKEKSGISLIVLVITIIVIIILATAVIVSIAKNNPIEEANSARYMSDIDSMQSALTMTVSKIAAEKKCNVKVKEGYVNSVKTGVKETEGTVNIEFENAVDGAQTATVKFGKGKNENNAYYTGKLLPVYPSGETSWYVDKNGTLALKVGEKLYNDDKAVMPVEHKGIIPEGVTMMNSTFEGCSALTQAPVIPKGITNMSSTFEGCSALTQAPVIPEGVTNMYGTFSECSALTKAPVIPLTVTNMRSTYRNCWSLEGIVTINANPTSLDDCFSGCSDLVLTGTSTKLQEFINKSYGIKNITIKPTPVN